MKLRKRKIDLTPKGNYSQLKSKILKIEAVNF